MLRMIVCGGRTFGVVPKGTAAADLAEAEALAARQCALFESVMRPYELQPLTVIQGAAPGADTLAAAWAFANGKAMRAYPAKWDLYGRDAGPIRNQLMLYEGRPDIVIAFPGGRGTADMVARARSSATKINVITVEMEP